MKKTLIASLLPLVITACSTSNTTLTSRDPIGIPKDRQTNLSKQLACFGDMYTERRTTLGSGAKKFAIVSISDETGSSTFADEVPVNMTEMAITAASKIGGSIRILHIPTNSELKKVGVHGISESRYFGDTLKANIYNSDTALIYASLTEYSKIDINKKDSTDLSGTFDEGKWEKTIGYNNSNVKTVGRLAMDFRIVDGSTGEVYNAATNSNYVDLIQDLNTNEFSISSNGNSIGYTYSTSIVDARHAALRSLIEIGLIRTIGKYDGLAYNRCLNNNIDNIIGINAIDEDVVNLLRREWRYGEYIDYKNGSSPQTGLRKLSYLDREAETSRFIGYFSFIKEGEKDPKSPTTQASVIDDKMLRVLLPKKLTNPESIQKCQELTQTNGLQGYKCSVKVPFTTVKSQEQLLSDALLPYLSNLGYQNADEALREIIPKFREAGLLPDPNDKEVLYVLLKINAPVSKDSRWLKN